ncbi:MAG: NAD-dependent deacylase [Hyphomicrobiaceae bacterium]
MAYDRIVILTGSGISAESGLSTFRDKDGLWSRIDYREVATPEGYARDPERVLAFYNMRRETHAGVAPNAAHLALARLESEHSAAVTVITQNVDELHERAGTRRLIHMHGEVYKALCAACGSRHAWREAMSLESVCPSCRSIGRIRPDVVWFGETPYELDRIGALVADADLFVSIGTSGTVYPAAGLVALARRSGAHTVELNLEPSEGVSLFHEAIHGKATEIVPNFVSRLLSGGG